MSNIKLILALLSVGLLSFFAVGCQATQVAVDSRTYGTAEYKNGCLYGKVNGHVAKVFAAANKAVDQSGYFRTSSNDAAPAMTQLVTARAKGDLKIEILLEEKAPGVTDVRIAFGKGDSARSQELLNKIYQNM